MSRDPHNGSVEKHRVWCWRNTECKHIMRWCGPSPAVSVFNPFMTRTIAHHSFDPVGSTHTSREVTLRFRPRPFIWLSEWRAWPTFQWWYLFRLESWALLNLSIWLSLWTHDPVRIVTSLWWCKIFHKGDIFEQLENLTFLKFLARWENFPNFSQCQVFATVKIFQHKKYLHSQTAYVHAIMTPYASCNRVTCRLLI